jgi:nickel-dependent lactate racemase
MARIEVPYGDTSIEAVVADDIALQVIDPPLSAAPPEAGLLLEQALDKPIGTRPLEELVKPDDSIVIVVNDHTRPGPNRQIVDAVMRRLQKARIPDDHIKFVVATGSHRASTEEELKVILGEEYLRRIRVVMHDCRDKDSLVCLGTVRDIPVWLNKEVVEASFVITTGLVAPHHTAGFSGGRKSILPGVAGLDTLKIHHSLPFRPFEPSMGRAEGNQFHEAALEAAGLVSVRFIVNSVQDMHNRDIAFVAGDLVLAHRRGMEICREANTVDIHGLADIVVASPGGHPRDSDLYQAQKALAVAEMLVRPGGVMILCANAECGIGEGLFVEWMKEGKSPEEIIERYRRVGFSVGNNKAFMYARALTKGRVVIVSHRLDPDELDEMMLGWAPDLQTALDAECQRKRPERIIVLPRAVSMILRVQ